MTPLNGPLQCFCQNVLAVNGSAALNTVQLLGLNVCKNYKIDQDLALLANNAIKYMIIAINFVLRMFIIKLITYIGKDTESEQTRLICNGVFVV